LAAAPQTAQRAAAAPKKLCMLPFAAFAPPPPARHRARVK
jgi:hypothetical protein